MNLLPAGLRYLIPLACLTLTLVGCGDESDPDSTTDGGLGVGELCDNTGECQSGLLCVGTICQDPATATSNGTTATSNGTTATSNGTTATSNGTTSTSNGTTATSNGTTATSNGTTATSNGTTATSNGTTSTSNGTTSTSNGTTSNRPPTLTGGISIFEAEVIANVFVNLRRGNAGAAFVEPGAGEEPPINTIGNCDVIQVRTNPAQSVGYDAGTITVEGTNPSVMLSSSEDGAGSVSYTSNLRENNESVYNPGAQLTVTASGGEHIEAFSGTIAAPAEHQMTSPAGDASVSGETTIAWNPAQSGLDVVINIAPLDAVFTPIDGPGLNCTVPSDSGSFTIPAAALDALQGPRLAITVIKVNNQEITVGPDTFILNTTYANGVVVTLN